MNEELYEKLTRLQWLLHKQQLRGYAAGGPMADTTRGQGRILAVLKIKDGISTRDLSYLLGIQIPSLNELLSKLVKGGYATREPSEQDKRVMLVKLTDKGREEQQPESVGFNDIFSCLNEDEQQAFGEYLDRVIGVLEANFTGDDEAFERTAAGRERLAEFYHMNIHRGGHGRLRFGGPGGFGHRDGFGGHGGEHGHGKYRNEKNHGHDERDE